MHRIRQCVASRRRLSVHIGSYCNYSQASPPHAHTYVWWCGRYTRGKSLLELWVSAFLSDSQPPLIFVWFTSNSHKHKPKRSILAQTILLEHMHKKFEINWTKIKGTCQSGKKRVTHDSKSDLPLVARIYPSVYDSHFLLRLPHHLHLLRNT